MFLKEQSEENGLSDDIRDYIDNKFKALESQISSLGVSGSKYNVIPAGKGLLQVIDIEKLAVVGNISYEGDIIGTPVVHGDELSIGLQKSRAGETNEVSGVIYSLPEGKITGQFRVEQREDQTFQSILGDEERLPKNEFDQYKQLADNKSEELENSLQTAVTKITDLEGKIDAIQSAEPPPPDNTENDAKFKELEAQLGGKAGISDLRGLAKSGDIEDIRRMVVKPDDTSEVSI